MADVTQLIVYTCMYSPCVLHVINSIPFQSYFFSIQALALFLCAVICVYMAKIHKQLLHLFQHIQVLERMYVFT